MPTSGHRPDRILDTLGTYCPIPVLRTARILAEMKSGEILELLSDDRGVLTDIPDWCHGHGHQYLGCREEARAYRLSIRKA